MNGERAYNQREPIVFAVDQRPFASQKNMSGRVNRFCVLHPLMTLSGERVGADRDGFPNPGRVWWLIRDDIDEHLVVPASIWTGTIEAAPRWDPSDPDSYRFQVNRRDIMPGGRDLVEIIPVGEDHPDLAYVQKPKPFPWPRPTTSTVILQGRRSVLGPLQSRWDPEAQRLHLACPTEMLRVPLPDFYTIARVELFKGTLNEFDQYAETEPFSLTLSKTGWLHLEQLRKAGEAFDGSSDAQILMWAARHQRFGRHQFTQLRELLTSLNGDAAEPLDGTDDRKRRRLLQLAGEAERVLTQEEQVARALADTPVFGELITRHAEAVVEQRVEREIQQRSKQIEEAMQPKLRALEQLKKDLDNLTGEYQRKAALEEEEFRKRMANRIKSLEERERSVGVRESVVVKQEAEITKRLEKVIRRYNESSGKLADELVAQLPIFLKVGAAGAAAPGGVNHAAPSAVAPAPALHLPSFLETRKGDPGVALAEEDFLAQFAHVVEQQGFYFSQEDLVNFHVCVKTGGLTVLAGISGTGKSSLPRLYAEALGCPDEYLHLPVRPDWLDDRDLVGAFNAVAQRFEPANSGLVDHLIAARLDRERDRGGIYLVCLDEMNLARVEHYFAQFLSKLELPLEQRALELFAQGLVQPADPYHPYQRLPLGDNLRFLGTVNIDETTHFFSPKVLDRAQVVVFRAPDLSVPRRPGKGGPVHGIKPVRLATYLAWRRQAHGPGAARDFLLQVNALLQKSQLGLGFRQYDRVLDYVESARPFFPEDKALDFQLMQVVLPRLRPTAPGFAETLQGLREAVTAERFPRSADHLARAEARVEDDFFQLL